MALVGVITQQLGDTIAGARTDVDVCVTYVDLVLSGMSLTALLITAGS